MMFVAAAAMMFASCGKDEDNNANNGGNNGGGNGGDNPGGIDSPALAGFDADGASLALFSVGEGRQVRFSRGNLQYQASTGLWRFAEQQYDMIGAGNDNISSTYSGWIDLFGYGTSGWNSSAVAYQPYSNSHNDNDYYPGGNSAVDLSGAYAQMDWGVYNAIANGGNQAGMWRTLSFEEWQYLISPEWEPNEVRNGKNGLATVMGIQGLVILCDNFVLPDDLTFVPGDYDYELMEMTYNNNVYEEADWRRMEAAGAIFLPAAEMRGEGGTIVLGNDPWRLGSGHYWTSTGTNCGSGDGIAEVSCFGFGNASGGTGFGCTSASNGFSVRLVKAE